MAVVRLVSRAQNALRDISSDDGCLAQPARVAISLRKSTTFAHPGEHGLGSDRQVLTAASVVLDRQCGSSILQKSLDLRAFFPDPIHARPKRT